jgi:hypothetical protein
MTSSEIFKGCLKCSFIEGFFKDSYRPLIIKLNGKGTFDYQSSGLRPSNRRPLERPKSISVFLNHMNYN